METLDAVDTADPNAETGSSEASRAESAVLATLLEARLAECHSMELIIEHLFEGIGVGQPELARKKDEIAQMGRLLTEQLRSFCPPDHLLDETSTSKAPVDGKESAESASGSRRLTS